MMDLIAGYKRIIASMQEAQELGLELTVSDGFLLSTKYIFDSGFYKLNVADKKSEENQITFNTIEEAEAAIAGYKMNPAH